MATKIMEIPNIEQSNVLKEYILPLGKEEFNQLEKNIIQEGCREALVVWKKDDKLILVDGHNRYKICKKHNIPFDINPIEFNSLEDVKVWMINNQLGRRNLNPDQMSYYRGMKYESLKQKKGGYDKVQQKGNNDISTYELLAREFNVSEKTIQRDAKFAKALNFIGGSNLKLKNEILNGEIKFKKADITLFANVVEDEAKWKFKNEADLYNKISLVKNEMLSKIESDLEEQKTADNEKIKKAQEELQQRDNLFPDVEGRIRRIKGQILSAMNRAIQDRDTKALDEIRKLIDRLSELLSE